jgi:hypothetical protein
MATMSDDDLVQMLGAIKDADSVELKLTIPDDQQRSTVFSLGMDPLDAQMRLVFFFDTPDLALDKAGVVVRARRVQGKGDDTVVKLRPVVPSELPEELRHSASFNVEVDAMPGGFVCSASMKGSLGPTEVKRVMRDGAPLKKLFSKEQRAFFAEHAPEGIGFEQLSILGPIFVLKLRWTPEELKRKMVAEIWLYPDGSRVLELSTKCLTTEAFQVAAETRAYLSSKGVDLDGEQSTKTRKALEYFAAVLAPSTPGS